jgi:hypothetical protein
MAAEDGKAAAPAHKVTSSRAVGLFGLLYFIVAANFVGDLFSCDLRRLLANSLVTKHVVLLLGALFWVTESNSNDKFGVLLIEAFVIYMLFVLSTKSKSYFLLPILGLAVVDQLLRLYIKSTPDLSDKTKRNLDITRMTVQGLCTVTIVGSFVGYLIKQVRDKGTDFNFSTFMLGTIKCEGGTGPLKRGST